MNKSEALEALEAVSIAAGYHPEHEQWEVVKIGQGGTGSGVYGIWGHEDGNRVEQIGAGNTPKAAILDAVEFLKGEVEVVRQLNAED